MCAHEYEVGHAWIFSFIETTSQFQVPLRNWTSYTAVLLRSAFYMRVGDPNSEIHASMARTLPIEPSL